MAEVKKNLKEDRSKLKPVVEKTSLVSSKESSWKKFVDNFIQEDLKDVRDYVLLDIVLPGIQNAIIDTLRMVFFHEIVRNGDRNRRHDYRSDYKGYSRSNGREYGNQRNDPVDYRRIVLKYREDAERVVKELRDRIYEFGDAKVSELLELCNVASEYTDNDYGWTDERDISIQRVSSGWLIKVSEARYLRR